MSPRILVIKKQFSIVYKDISLNEDFKSFPLTLTLAFLFAYYFLFDVGYPKVLNQILG